MTVEEKAFRDKIDRVELEELMYDEFYELIAEAKNIGYKKAMHWRDPKEELPETGKPVLVKYRTAKNVEKHGIGKYFNLGIGNPWTIEGSTSRNVIGWRPIE
jgi:hypothetical protein